MAAFARRLIIMVRIPVAGQTKTRLAREAGLAVALRFARATSRIVVGRLGRDPRWRVALAVTPDAGLRSRALPPRYARCGQGRGDLGARMQRLMDQAGPGPVVIVGTDIPRIEPAFVMRAFRLLGSHDAVFGPAADGGYWLVGSRRRPRTLRMFSGVRWSTQHALADTLANLQGHSVGYTQTLRDVDTAEDLAALRHSIGRLVLPP
jgi:rSAM/selenodomain-associated transferase 1